MAGVVGAVDIVRDLPSLLLHRTAGIEYIDLIQSVSGCRCSTLPPAINCRHLLALVSELTTDGQAGLAINRLLLER